MTPVVAVQTRSLCGTALDWAVAQCLDMDPEIITYGGEPALRFEHKMYQPSKSWEQAGEVIGREGIDLYHMERDPPVWEAEFQVAPMQRARSRRSSPLAAAMCAYVIGRKGDVMEIPEALMNEHIAIPARGCKP